MPLNQWTHLALVRDAGVVKVYANGESVSAWNRGNDLGSLGSVTIGASAHNTAEIFTGYIDEVRVTKGLARYNSSFSPPTTAFDASVQKCFTNGVERACTAND